MQTDDPSLTVVCVNLSNTLFSESPLQLRFNQRDGDGDEDLRILTCAGYSMISMAPRTQLTDRIKQVVATEREGLF